MTYIYSKTKNGKASAILTRIARADKSAARQCVEVYGKMIWALAKQYTDSAAEAERAVPGIFNDIWVNAKFCDLEISDEAVWIALIARRHLSGCALSGGAQQRPEMSNALAGDSCEIQKMMTAVH